MDRLDAFLVSFGLVSGREKAKELIAAGKVTVNGVAAKKASQTVSEKDRVECDASSLRYVGRGGFKLEHALSMVDIPVDGAVAMDVGASTGGFTDCMLQNGAARVFAVDVGHGQLHPRLRADSRVVCLEGTDIRKTEEIQNQIDPHSVAICSIDVSFISLKAVLPAVLPFLENGAFIIALIKPQFEAGRAALDKHGIVRDPAVHRYVTEDLMAFFETQKCRVLAVDRSPITGGDGNIEFLAVLCYNGDC